MVWQLLCHHRLTHVTIRACIWFEFATPLRPSDWSAAQFWVDGDESKKNAAAIVTTAQFSEHVMRKCPVTEQPAFAIEKAASKNEREAANPNASMRRPTNRALSALRFRSWQSCV